MSKGEVSGRGKGKGEGERWGEVGRGGERWGEVGRGGERRGKVGRGRGRGGERWGGGIHTLSVPKCMKLSMKRDFISISGI